MNSGELESVLGVDGEDDDDDEQEESLEDPGLDASILGTEVYCTILGEGVCTDVAEWRWVGEGGATAEML
jgi:hypothetical protein